MTSCRHPADQPPTLQRDSLGSSNPLLQVGEARLVAPQWETRERAEKLEAAFQNAFLGFIYIIVCSPSVPQVSEKFVKLCSRGPPLEGSKKKCCNKKQHKSTNVLLIVLLLYSQDLTPPCCSSLRMKPRSWKSSCSCWSCWEGWLAFSLMLSCCCCKSSQDAEKTSRDCSRNPWGLLAMEHIWEGSFTWRKQQFVKLCGNPNFSQLHTSATTKDIETRYLLDSTCQCRNLLEPLRVFQEVPFWGVFHLETSPTHQNLRSKYSGFHIFSWIYTDDE